MVKWLIVLVGLVAVLVFIARHAASILLVDNPVKSDVILVLAGEGGDSRFWRGVELLKEGYGQSMILDVTGPFTKYGISNTEIAKAFVAANAPAGTSVCEALADSTFTETVFVAHCLQALHPKSVLIVTSDYHTRRALAIFQKRLPQYEWHVAASEGPLVDQSREGVANDWWNDRGELMTILEEFEKWIWWNLVDQWRATPIAAE